MVKYVDWFIMLLTGLLLGVWLFRAFNRWLNAPLTGPRIELGKGGKIANDDEHVALLEGAGYSVISGKHVIPVTVDLNKQMLSSRLYIDYIAEKGDQSYIVKTARERMPMDWTGSGVRDRLLIYSLLLPQCTGILYVDNKQQSIHKVIFYVGDE